MAGDKRIKGITIEIGGDTTELQKALKGVNTEIRDTQTELKDVNRLLKLDPGNVTLVRQKQELLTTSIKDSKDKLDTLKDAYKQVQAQVEKGDLGTDKMRSLEREIASTEQSLKTLRTESVKSGNGLNGMGGSTTSANLEALSGKAGAVASATAGISTGAGLALGGLVALSEKSAATALSFNKTAAQTGLTVEQVQELSYASTMSGVSMDSLTVGMKKLTASMGSARSGTGSQAEAFKQLGVSVTDSNGNLRDANSVMGEVFAAMGGMENTTERNVLAHKLFGKSYQELAPLMKNGGTSLQKYTQYARENGLVMSQDEVNGAAAAGREWRQFSETMQIKMTELGGKLATNVAPFIEKVLNGAIGLVTWFGNLPAPVQNTILVVLGLVAAISPLAGLISSVATIVGVITPMLPALGTAFAVLTGPIGLTVAAIAAVTAGLIYLYNTNEGFRNFVNTAWDGIKNTVAGAADNIGLSLGIVADTLTGNTEGAMDKAKALWDKLPPGVQDTLLTVYDNVKGGMDRVSEFFGGLQDQAFKWGSDMIQGIIDGINSLIDNAKKAAEDVGKAIKGVLGFSLPKEGPLSDADTYMPDMMNLYIAGIRGKRGDLTREAALTAASMQSALTASQAKVGSRVAGITAAGQTAANYTGGGNLQQVTQAIKNLRLTVSPVTKLDGKAIAQTTYNYTMDIVSGDISSVKMAGGV